MPVSAENHEHHFNVLKEPVTTQQLAKLAGAKNLLEVTSDAETRPVIGEVNTYEGVSVERKRYLPHARNIREIASLRINKSQHEYFYTNVIVHFDLKGAPPRLEYFLALLEFIAKGGATGVLIEWEDMFPWSGKLESVRNTNAYSRKEVRQILGKAKSLKLEVIPLVQTFGHMEWILKYEKFRKYRENDEYPQVICIGDDEAVDLVKTAIRQVVRLHKPFGIKRFHIGADEAFEFGTCKASKEKEKKLGSREKLAIRHLANISEYTRNITGEATILAWHDMLRSFIETGVKIGELGKLIQPVVWDYSEYVQGVQEYTIRELVLNFGKIWASSAFKGADSPTAMYNRYVHYEKNNVQWVLQQRSFRQQSEPVNFEGIIITGWSRYDHMAGLCEIWPVSVPSMLLNTQIALIGANPVYALLRGEEITNMAERRALEIMNCPENRFFQLDTCGFPGKIIYDMFQVQFQDSVKSIENELKTNYKIQGWLSPYNIRHNISQNWYLKEISQVLLNYQDHLYRITERLKKEMKTLFYDNTVDEFFFSNVDPYVEKLNHYFQSAQKLLKIRVQKRRNFVIERTQTDNPYVKNS
ncbi:hypothetical protein RB195_015694 [Necator americanus]|uniref:beta-N-acetylhexosaminidase n=1 Tax=Necator americanus TaxID=51031 RepID=A0ABR1E5S9_NECAM